MTLRLSALAPMNSPWQLTHFAFITSPPPAIYTRLLSLNHAPSRGTLHYPPPHCTKPSTSVWAHFRSWLSASHIAFNIRSAFVDLLCRAPGCASEVEIAGSWISKELCVCVCLHELFRMKSLYMFIMFSCHKENKVTGMRCFHKL